VYWLLLPRAIPPCSEVYCLFLEKVIDPESPTCSKYVIFTGKGLHGDTSVHICRKSIVYTVLLLGLDDVLPFPTNWLDVFQALPRMWLVFVFILRNEGIRVFRLIQVAQGVVDFTMLGLVRSDIQ